MPEELMLCKMWNDPEIRGRIYLQLCHLFANEIIAEERELFFSHCFSVMHKLTAIKYHMDNYKRIEKQQFKEAMRSFKKNPQQTFEAFELIFEMEAFLFQVKSSLDMLIKLMIPVVGPHFFKTYTFHKQGDNLIKGLDQYKKKKGVYIEAVDDLKNLTAMHKEGWIKTVVDWRDELNHEKALRDYKFLPRRMPNGLIVPIKPKFKGHDTTKLMSTIYYNCIEYHQDFMSFALAIKAGPMFTLMPERQERVLEIFKTDAAIFIKWVWGLTKKISGEPQPETDKTS